MNIREVIAQLRAERACLDEALVSLERLELKRGPRRGRPPLWTKVSSITPKVEESSEGSTKRHRRGERMTNSAIS
jgi:hypothetical protein